jgi:hypothetical protein
MSHFNFGVAIFLQEINNLETKCWNENCEITVKMFQNIFLHRKKGGGIHFEIPNTKTTLCLKISHINPQQKRKIPREPS